jgi:hypothetical protein
MGCRWNRGLLRKQGAIEKIEGRREEHGRGPWSESSYSENRIAIIAIITEISFSRNNGNRDNRIIFYMKNCYRLESFFAKNYAKRLSLSTLVGIVLEEKGAIIAHFIF